MLALSTPTGIHWDGLAPQSAGTSVTVLRDCQCLLNQESFALNPSISRCSVLVHWCFHSSARCPRSFPCVTLGSVGFGECLQVWCSCHSQCYGTQVHSMHLSQWGWTETSEFGPEKGLLHRPSKENKWLVLMTQIPWSFRQWLKTGLGGGSQDTRMISSWTFWLMGGEVTGDVLRISTFWFQEVWGLCVCSQHVVTIFHLGGGLSFYKTIQRYASDCYLHSSRKKWVTEISDSIVLILNWLKLLFGTWGRSWRLKSFFFYCEIIHMLWQNKKILNIKKSLWLPLSAALCTVYIYYALTWPLPSVETPA